MVPLPLPCPASAGWELIAQAELPRLGQDGRPLGGFSAAALDSQDGRLWLLSDAPEPQLQPVAGLGALGSLPLRIGSRLMLREATGEPFAQPLDGEGLVLEGADIWIVSEGRRTAERPAQLLRFDRSHGRLLEAIALPPDWRTQPGRGLGANQGPESLTLLPSPAAASGSSRSAGPSLLLAAERPLLQDPPDRLRLLAYGPLARAMPGAHPSTTRPAFRALGPLALALEGPDWGLTELLALPGSGLLGLVRGFAPPAQWSARLLLLPPAEAPPPLQPLQQWDLLAEGLTPDNWEGLAAGPPLSDGRPTVLLVSDDNFSSLQASRIARIAPRHGADCHR